MIKSKFFWFAIVSILGLTLACIAPGLPAQQPSINTLDPNSLSTAIAGTAAALASQTAQANPLTNLPPPAPALTVAPTEPTTPANTVAATSTLVFSGYGTALSKQADGSTLFIDQKLNYQLIIPAGWYPFRINEPEFYKLWEMPISMTPLIRGNLTSIQGYDPNLFRLFAFDLREEHLRDNVMTGIDVTLAQGIDSYSKFITNMQKAYSRYFASNRVLSSEVEINPSGLELGIVEFELHETAATGNATIYEKQILYKIQTGIIAIRLDTTYDLKDQVMNEFYQTKDSVKLAAP